MPGKLLAISSVNLPNCLMVCIIVATGIYQINPLKTSPENTEPGVNGKYVIQQNQSVFNRLKERKLQEFFISRHVVSLFPWQHGFCMILIMKSLSNKHFEKVIQTRFPVHQSSKHFKVKMSGNVHCIAAIFWVIGAEGLYLQQVPWAIKSYPLWAVHFSFDYHRWNRLLKLLL